MTTLNLKPISFRYHWFRKSVDMEAGGLSTKIKIFLAFGAIYIIWGSTYLAIRFAIETIPPFFMMGCRSLLAGGILYIWGRLRGNERPKPAQWMTAAVIGILLFLGGNGALAWSEQVIPSGVAALIVATTPIWMALLQALRYHDNPLTGRVILGLLFGFFGMVLLTEPAKVLGGTPVDPIGAVVLLIGTLSWSVGSVYAKKVSLPKSPMLASGMNLLSGGGSLLLVSLLSRETMALTSVSLRSLVSLLYLIAFGSIIAFTAYIWLLRTKSPTQVSTYAFVNPVIAVLIGWLAGGEILGPRILTAALLMVTGVGAIVAQNSTTHVSVKKQLCPKAISFKTLTEGKKLRMRR